MRQLDRIDKFIHVSCPNPAPAGAWGFIAYTSPMGDAMWVDAQIVRSVNPNRLMVRMADGRITYVDRLAFRLRCCESRVMP